jgi:hypothetical protein
MNILVCVKQVPDTTEIKIDPVKNTLIRDGVPSIVNPFDGYALEAAALNINHKRSDLKLYEFGNCYFYDNAKKEEGGLAPYSETYTLGILVSGQTNEASWNIKTAQSDFYTLKVYAEKLLARFGVNINNAQIDPLESDLYREAVRFTFNNKKLFDIGIVAKKIRNIFDIKQEVYFLEMDFDRLIKLASNVKIGAKELSKYPEVRRDLALLVDKSVTFRQLRDLAFKTERKLLKKVGLFDVYEGDKLPEGKKSYALNFVLEDTTKTMTDTIIEKVRERVIDNFRNSGMKDFYLDFKIYGKKGVMNMFPKTADSTSDELLIIIEAVAPTQEQANTICGFARSTMLHYGYEGRISTAGNLAFPFSPSDCKMGAVYEFNVYHLMRIEDTCEPFPMSFIEF